MDKILVEITFPATGESFDVRLPTRMPLHQILGMVSKMVAELSGGRLIPSRDMVVCDRESGAVFDINMNVQELCLHNGSRLMVI